MYNGHADVTALIDELGEIKAKYYYNAFGNPTETTGAADNPFRYAAYQYDDETELYYLNARYYNSKIARFISEDTYTGDPNDPLSLNLYVYCHNNPITYYDPTGHYVRVTDEDIIKEYEETYGKKMSQEDIDRLKTEGTLHFDETKIDNDFRNTELYKRSADSENNYKYEKKENGNNVEIKFDAEKYQLDRESRLYFLKHFARVQANEYKYEIPSYVRPEGKENMTPYSDAETYRKIANFSLGLKHLDKQDLVLIYKKISAMVENRIISNIIC